MIIEKNRLYRSKYSVENFSENEIVQVISDEDEHGWFSIKSIDCTNAGFVHNSLFRNNFEPYIKQDTTKPAHYDTAIDTIDFMKANFSREAVEGFMRGNAIKYLQRNKGEKLSDLKKAEAYIKMLIELEEEQK